MKKLKRTVQQFSVETSPRYKLMSLEPLDFY